MNNNYSELVYKKHQLVNDKSTDKAVISQLDRQLLKLEIQLTSQGIFAGVREAFKHIPPRL